MTEQQASYEDARFGAAGFEYPDEPQREPSQEAMQMTRDAIGFVLAIVSRSRTGRSALMRLAVVSSLFGNTRESSAEIAKRYGVSRRSVERCKAELPKEFLVRVKVERSHSIPTII